jgi:hypothetical protein
VFRRFYRLFFRGIFGWAAGRKNIATTIQLKDNFYPIVLLMIAKI